LKIKSQGTILFSSLAAGFYYFLFAFIFLSLISNFYFILFIFHIIISVVFIFNREQIFIIFIFHFLQAPEEFRR